MQGPCPIDSRRTISGQRAPSERPANSWSTPRNAQSTSKRKLPGPRMTSEPNLFQCFPQGAMHARATQTSPKQPNIKRKGHKRSNIIRMSNLSRSTSTVQYEKNDWQCGEVAYIDGQKETHVSSRVGRGSGYETRWGGITRIWPDNNSSIWRIQIYLNNTGLRHTRLIDDD